MKEGPCIKKLAKSIAEDTLLAPPALAVWDKIGFNNYCDLLNRIINPIHLISPNRYRPNYPQDSSCPDRFIVLLAGHRRVLAIRQLLLDKNGNAFPDGKVNDCKVYREPSPDRAFRVQLHENSTQRPLRQWCEFAVAARFYLRQKAEDKNLTQETFAHQYGISTDTMSTSLQLLELPLSVQEVIMSTEGDPKKAIVPQKNVNELHRLMNVIQRISTNCNEKEIEAILVSFALRAIQPHSSFRLAIDQMIRQIEGQLPLFELTADDAERGTKQFIASKTTGAVNAGADLLACILRLVKVGVVSAETPFSAHEARRAIVTLYRYQFRLNGLLKELFINGGPELQALLDEITEFNDLLLKQGRKK